MTLREQVDKLKAEALVLSTYFSLTEAQLKPVAEAVKASDALWDSSGYVEPQDLERAADAINDAIEDVCLANKISDYDIEQLLPVV